MRAIPRLSTLAGLALLALLGAACGGDDGGDDAPAAPPAASTEVTATAATTAITAITATTPPEAEATTGSAVEAGGARPLPASGPLEPGTYVTQRMEPTLAMTVGDGWSVAYEEQIDNVTLAFGVDPAADTGELRLLTILRLTNTFDTPFLPAAVLSGEEPGRDEHLVPVPEDVHRWMSDVPGLDVGPATRATIRGRDVVRFDLEVDPEALPPGAAASCPAELPGCVAMFSASGDTETLGYTAGTRVRATVVPLPDGGRLLVTADAPPDGFEAFASEVDAVLERLELP